MRKIFETQLRISIADQFMMRLKNSIMLRSLGKTPLADLKIVEMKRRETQTSLFSQWLWLVSRKC